ncbi:unnamed protein product [Larinioides sclopetarius]|uniref:Thyroglobulin type-1 domain-containing protein n=1 Tax=Larinioides sclopetarius TaxID=280406 RepID=A0AAV2AN56_9ARAC
MLTKIHKQPPIHYDSSIVFHCLAAPGVIIAGRFVPECDDNGDYAKQQCGDGAYCYCVNQKTGKQIGKAKQFGRGLHC